MCAWFINRTQPHSAVLCSYVKVLSRIIQFNSKLTCALLVIANCHSFRFLYTVVSYNVVENLGSKFLPVLRYAIEALKSHHPCFSSSALGGGGKKKRRKNSKHKTSLCWRFSHVGKTVIALHGAPKLETPSINISSQKTLSYEKEWVIINVVITTDQSKSVLGTSCLTARSPLCSLRACLGFIWVLRFLPKDIQMRSTAYSELALGVYVKVNDCSSGSLSTGCTSWD